MKKPPLDRNSAQKWLTVWKYGQFWNSRKTPGVFNDGVLHYGRSKLWPEQYVCDWKQENTPLSPPDANATLLAVCCVELAILYPTVAILGISPNAQCGDQNQSPGPKCSHLSNVLSNLPVD